MSQNVNKSPPRWSSKLRFWSGESSNFAWAWLLLLLLLSVPSPLLLAL
jgi:hypothetical protein